MCKKRKIGGKIDYDKVTLQTSSTARKVFSGTVMKNYVKKRKIECLALSQAFTDVRLLVLVQESIFTLKVRHRKLQFKSTNNFCVVLNRSSQKYKLVNDLM